MTDMKNFPLAVCLFCDMVWSLTILAACTYIVFWLGQSGWWFALAVFLCGCWSCKGYRSPEQIAVDSEEH